MTIAGAPVSISCWSSPSSFSDNAPYAQIFLSLCTLGSDLWKIFFFKGWNCSDPCVGPTSSQMMGECWQVACKLAKHFCIFCVSEDRREVITMHCKGVRYRHRLERRQQLCEPCAQCLTCNGSGGTVWQKCFIFCSALQTWGIKRTVQWDMFQDGKALLVHVPLTISFGTQFEQCSSCLISVLVLPLLLLPLLLWVKLLLPVTVPKFPC